MGRQDWLDWLWLLLELTFVGAMWWALLVEGVLLW